MQRSVEVFQVDAFTRTRFTGRIENGEIELTRERESSHNAGNSGVVEQRRNAPRQTFRLKRLT